MKTITLKRSAPQGKAIRGLMTLPFSNETIQLETLENADFVIPAGTYPLDFTWSPKFQKYLPEILDVPDREGIRIHTGSVPEHSEGCILVDRHGSMYIKSFLGYWKEKINEDVNIIIE